jgi:hypothetical protein
MIERLFKIRLQLENKIRTSKLKIQKRTLKNKKDVSDNPSSAHRIA